MKDKERKKIRRQEKCHFLMCNNLLHDIRDLRSVIIHLKTNSSLSFIFPFLFPLLFIQQFSSLTRLTSYNDEGIRLTHVTLHNLGKFGKIQTFEKIIPEESITWLHNGKKYIFISIAEMAGSYVEEIKRFNARYSLVSLRLKGLQIKAIPECFRFLPYAALRE